MLRKFEVFSDQIESRLTDGLLGRLLVLAQKVLGVVQAVLEHHVRAQPQTNLKKSSWIENKIII